MLSIFGPYPPLGVMLLSNVIWKINVFLDVNARASK